MDKKETLQKLYTLRGGLSFLAVTRDEVRNSQIRINNNLKETEEEKKQSAEALNSAKKNKEKMEAEKDSDLAVAGASIFAILFGILLIFLHTRCYYWFQGNSGFGKFLSGIVFYLFSSIFNLGAAAFVIGGVFVLFISIFSIPIGKKNLQEAEKHVTTLIENQGNQLAVINGLERNTASEKEKQKALIIQFRAAYTAIKKSFASFLDERDWKNIDYIIYCFETGRALDMRDALIQVDKENRAERLEKAINGAVKAINQSIRNATVSMQKSMQELGGLIVEQTKTMISAMNANHSDTINALNKGFSGLNNQNKVQTALLAKINVSSSDMARDVSSIKNYGVQCYI